MSLGRAAVSTDLTTGVAPVRAWQRKLRIRMATLDLIAAVIAGAAVVALRYDGQHAALGGIDYRLLALAGAPLWLGVVAVTGGYEARILGLGTEEFRRIANAGVRMLAALVLIGFLTKADLSRTVIIASVALTTMLTVLGRWLARRFLHHARRRGRWGHRVLVVGDVSSVRALIVSLRRVPYAGFEVVGACLPGTLDHVPDEGVRVVGTPDEVVRALRDVDADTVAVAGSATLGDHGLRRLAWALEGGDVDLLVAPGLTDVAGPRVAIRPVDGVPLLQIDAPRFSGWRRVVKEAFDRIVASVLLVICAVPIALIAVVIVATSRGPVFFRQTRVGRDGATFRLWKFRTMIEDAAHRRPGPEDNEADGVLFKMKSDPRVTPVGRVLRRWSLDELPQLLNVISGSMSLVGPRPPLPSEVEEYGDDVRRRLLVKPGMTGLWQVSGRSDLPWEECVRLDLHYVENWSVTLDVMILARTLLAVVRGTGAY